LDGAQRYQINHGLLERYPVQDVLAKINAGALAEYVAHRKRLEILSLFGTIDFDPKYDYKAERKKRR